METSRERSPRRFNGNNWAIDWKATHMSLVDDDDDDGDGGARNGRSSRSGTKAFKLLL